MDSMRPEVRNCQRCGKLFRYVGVPICRECQAKEEEQYAAVKAYLSENPGATVPEVHKATGVPVEVIVDFVKTGLLVIAGTGDLEPRCKICGKPISAGQICSECLQALSSFNREGGAKAEEPRTVSVKEPDEKVSGQVYIMDMISRRRKT
ncbi:MAG TPA: MerR family transcriptional regulator [Firmicutes bacterium]|nr:MerR family transcriptional regulator [Candidatus Fermentithermobacillaceae bacterium]